MKSMMPIVLLLPLLLVPRTAFTTAAALSAEPSSTFVTVGELMRLDAELALEAARKRRQQDTVAAVTERGNGLAADGGAEAPRLVGIYGVGKRLFAEVRSGSRALLFLKGHSQPVGQEAGGSPYRLREIAGACVRLEQQGNESVLCLPTTGGQ